MYAKLFASLYQGTLRGCSDEILVFTNLIAHADSAGIVDKHWRAIAEECGISRERVEAAIAKLESPDAESRSPEEGGRRLVRLDEHRVWGWRIVNHGKYRAIRSEDDRRLQNRLAQERWRNKLKEKDNPARKQNKPRKPISAESEAEAEAEAEARISPPTGERAAPSKKERANGRSGTRLPDGWRPDAMGRAYASDRGLDPDSTADAFTDWWAAANGPNSVKRDWSAAFRTWCRRDAAGPVGRAATGAVRAPRGNDAFYEQLAVIASRDRDK